MKTELKYSLDKFGDAVKKLDSGVKQAKNQLGRDGVIKGLNLPLNYYGRHRNYFY